MIFLVMLAAYSVLIKDAAQLDANKPYYENFELSRSEKRSFCEIACPCPRGPSPMEAVFHLGSTSPKPDVSEQNESYPRKRFDDIVPRGTETLYSIWRQNRLNYPTYIRNLFDQA